MYLNDIISASEILEDPDLMDRVEDPYVVVMQDVSALPVFTPSSKRKEIITVMTLMHKRGWETLNVTFDAQGRMVALLKNPRAKRKNMDES